MNLLIRGIEYETYYFEFRKLRENKENRQNGFPPILTPFNGAAEDSCAYFVTLNSLSILFIGLFLIKSPKINYLMIFLAIPLLLEFWISKKILFAYTSFEEDRYIKLFEQIDSKIKSNELTQDQR